MEDSRKRSYEELELSTLDSMPSTKAAKVHGLFTSLSPMKNSARGKSTYFEGQLSDDTRSVRVVGFDQQQQEKMTHHFENKTPIVLDNCQIEKPKYTEEMQVLIKQSTKIATSPKKVETPVFQLLQAISDITLNQLQHQDNNQQISVSVKVVQIMDEVEVKPGLIKQDITVSDETSSARVTLWQQDIGRFQEQKSYKLHNVIVREYNGIKYISLKSGSTIIPMEDIKGVVEEIDTEDEVTNVLIAAIPRLSMGKFCVSCKTGMVESQTDKIGTCTRCEAVQRLDKCNTNISATLLIDDDGTQFSLQANWPIIQTITKNQVDTNSTPEEVKEHLLLADPFTAMFTSNNNITSVHRS